MRQATGFMRIVAVVPMVILLQTQSLPADVAPGDVVDQDSWKKAETLLPEPVLEWVKKGDWVLNVGTLSYTPDEFYSPDKLKYIKANAGRYDVDDDGNIVDAKTGKHPDYFAGLPFPDVQPEEPKAGVKIVYNQVFGRAFSDGNVRTETSIVWMGQAGFEREVIVKYLNFCITGNPRSESLPNPRGYERQQIISIRAPYDIAGTSVMLWRYHNERRDVNFSYLPAIRRVRRMSPASRSDAFIGSDICLDDTAGGTDMKIPDFEWKLVKTQSALLPFMSSQTFEVRKTGIGGWSMTHDHEPIVYGSEKDGWKGASWAPTNLVWVKRKVYVIEINPKDPYYNYGPHYIWIDAVRFTPSYKVIHDRANKYWKCMVQALFAASSSDGAYRSMGYGIGVLVDERKMHATWLNTANPLREKQEFVFEADIDPNEFTLGGFQKYCK